MTTETQIKSAQLHLIPRSADVEIRAAGEDEGRYGARFRGPQPVIHENGDTVTVAYPRLRGMLRRGTGELRLDPALAWTIRVDGGASRLVADLRGLPLRSLEIAGGANDVEVALPEPTGPVTVRIAGGASKVNVRRAAGTAALLRISGGATKLTFDDQRFGAIGGETRLASAGADEAGDRYEIEIAGGASNLSVTTDGRAGGKA